MTATASLGLPITDEERQQIDVIAKAAYAGARSRSPESDVRWLLHLLAKVDDRLVPVCACECHASDTEHCDSCCAEALCEDCRAYARQA